MRVREVFLTRGRISNLRDPRGPDKAVHDLDELVLVALMERFRDGAGALIDGQRMFAIRVEGGRARGELSAVLDVQKHSWQ